MFVYMGITTNGTNDPILEYLCPNCGHTTKIKKNNGEPTKCPKCKKKHDSCF